MPGVVLPLVSDVAALLTFQSVVPLLLWLVWDQEVGEPPTGCPEELSALEAYAPWPVVAAGVCSAESTTLSGVLGRLTA